MTDHPNSGFSIQLNGEPYSIDADAGLTALLKHLNLRPGRIAIELNQSIIPKSEWPHVELRPGDRVEIVNFVGGG